MLIKPEQLARQLARGSLASLYLVHGEEPLQRVESLEQIRRAARSTGVSERLRFDVNTGIDWAFLQAETRSLSLFADRRLFEIDLGRKRPDNDAVEFITTWIGREGHDDLCVLTAETLPADEQKKTWFRELDRAGCHIPCRLPEGQAFTGWLKERARSRERELGDEAAELLAARTEGNLLAAAQEIDLLLLLTDAREITLEALLAAVGDSARYDVYKVVDAALAGDLPRAVRMARGVREEGHDPIPVCWTACRELRTLARVSAASNPDSGFAAERVWPSRQGLLRRVLQRLTPAALEALLKEALRIDLLAKGLGEDDPWEALELLLVALAGGPWLGMPGKYSRKRP